MEQTKGDNFYPAIEIDDETEHITLRWSFSDVSKSLVFRKNEKALIVTTVLGNPTVVSSKTIDMGKFLEISHDPR